MLCDSWTSDSGLKNAFYRTGLFFFICATFVQSRRDIGPTSERCLGGESLQTSHCQTGTAFLLLGADTSVLQRFLAEPVVELQTRFDPPAAGHPVVPDFGTAGS